TDQTSPTDLADPTADPTDLADPTADPTDLADPTDQTSPTDLADPTADPTDLADPTADPTDLADRTDQTSPTDRTGPATGPVPAAGPVGAIERDGIRPAPAPGEDPTHVADLVRHLLAEALHRAPEDIGDDEQFLTLGLDSLTAVDLARRLERELGRTLPATLLFEYRTLGELAAHLATGPQPIPTVSGFSGFSGYEPPADDGLPGPLTPLQLAFRTTEALHEGVTAYGYVRQSVSGPLDSALLGRALARLAARHPMLRLRITRDGDTRPRQYAVPAAHVDAAPRWYEVRETAPDQLNERDEPNELEQALCNRPFDLTSEDPVRAVLVREHPHLSHLLLVVHHAAADGYSLKVLGEELWALYTALVRGDDSAPELPSPHVQFADYAAAVAAERQSPAHARDQEYWRDRLAEHMTVSWPPALPYDGDPEAPPAPPLTHHRTEVDEALTATLREVAARHDVSLFHLLLAVYGRCLARWSGQRAVAVNVARARRELPLPGIDRLVGPLADTLPVFVSVDPAEPVTVLARRLRRIWQEAEAHPTLSSPDIARLLRAAGRGRGPAPRTAAEAGFSFARFPVVHGADWPVTVTPTGAATATAATRLGLLCWEADAGLRLSWNHPARLFRPETVRRLADSYVAELRAAVAEPPAPAQGPAHGGIVDRLCAQFRATPDAVAVDTGRTTLTYAALDAASAALAARLRAHGVRPGDLVGLLTEPGADTVTGVVGILRSGAGWVPLDAAHPAARHQDQVNRTGVRVLVCDASTRTAAAAAAAVPGDVTLIAADDPSPAPPTPAPPTPGEPPAAHPDSVAYVIFTSGSTGRPKAVPVTHRSMTNYLDWALSTFGYGPGDRLAQTASVCFDASVRQLLAPLLAGATVHTLGRDLLRDPEALLDRVVEDRVTVWSSVPTLWERLLTAAEERARQGDRTPPDLSALRWVHVGGEALPAAHVRRWFDLLDAAGNRGSGHRISNLYGPTEATINATCHIITTRPADDVRHLPIGRPIAGTELAVVGEDGSPCAPGEAGELLITGTGLTPGYLGDPELTAAAFTERDGRRWYRSGDRVRRGADGVLEFLGRLDDQVKVRGHRVEPGEVEAALLTHPGVARAAVLLRDGRLVAYVEPRPGADEPDAREVRSFLSRALPPYMLPARVRSVPALPLTGTGKIDRNRLARPDDTTTTTTTTAEAVPTPRRGTPPATPTERLVAGVWCEVLEVPEVFQEDDFFTLGGDSMTVLELFARLRTARPALPRPTTVYTHRTLTALAAAVDAAGSGETSEQPVTVPPATDTVPAPYPLTPSQRGFLLADALTDALAPSGGSAWLARFRLTGPLNHDLFQRSVDVLVARHPMLRTVFPAGARPPVQQELPASLRLPVETETLADPDVLEERVAEEARRRFEPWAWPLLRLRLFAVSTASADEHVLLVHAHHLIGDGYSAALLARELLTVYDRFERGLPDGLEPLRSTFRDHVAHLAERTQAPNPRPSGDPQAVDYDTRHRAPYTPPVLRAAHPDSPTAPGFHTTGFTLHSTRTQALRHLARDAGTTPYAPFLTAYYRALTALTGRRDLVLGLAVTGREETTRDAHRVFGPFAEAVALRPAGPGEPLTPLTPPTPPEFGEDLRRIATEAVAARTAGPMDLRTDQGLPCTAQFFFTFLDFTSLGPPPDTTLTLHTDDTDTGTALAPPPVGTNVFLAVRPTANGEGMRVTVRASATAFNDDELTAFAGEIRRQLENAPSPEPTPTTGTTHTTQTVPLSPTPHLDAALVGYLPTPQQLAAFAGLPPQAAPGREQLRALLFPGGRARLLEAVTTPLGRSGFVSLPVFADELAPGDDLAARTARGVELAASLGARCVSLAGMIPSLTGYGYDVLRETPATTTALTTGHATTTVSVVKTVHAALDATGRDLSELTLAVVGCGSIGTSSLRLLLALGPRPPARLLLCDLPGSGPRLGRLAMDLSAENPTMRIQVVESGQDLPSQLYEADVVVTAVSGPTTLLDPDRLRPGTIVVDDSFPHCFDTGRALDRMKNEQDVLVVGGGLLALDATETHVPEDLHSLARTVGAGPGAAGRHHLPGTLASCRLESLLHAHMTDPGRPRPSQPHGNHTAPPLIHGLVDLPRALAHWDAADLAGVRPAPLHLLDHVVTRSALDALPPPP
ncbi:amino acid adenylation domain-containing protein, partial [Streptomyces acidicola]|uniref:amino acid adenylation domain-containing protein n=1 Tax=Streptomyces acidicola TaxID=2596892 RepID=UPI003796087A